MLNTRVRTKPDDTRKRIVETAEALFRQLGYAKTTVADIAAELQMSPANIYRFFPSKNAIVEAICKTCLVEVEERAWAAARAKEPAARRLEQMILGVLAYHKDNLITEQRVNELVVAAIEDNWETVRAHKNVLCEVTEVILRDGIAAGEFEPIDPHATAELLLRSLVAFMHPLIIGQCLDDGQDIETEARASVSFLLRAITPR